MSVAETLQLLMVIFAAATLFYKIGQDNDKKK